MKVVRFRTEEYQAVGLLEGKAVLDFTRAFTLYCVAYDLPTPPAVHSLLHLLQAGLFTVETFAEVKDFIDKHDLTRELTVKQAELLSPLPRPPRIIALGRNYTAHASETGHQPPKEPIFFAKASTAVIGPNETVIYPRGLGRIDHEVELAVIIGKAGRRISRRKAAEHIAGYTILNDVTARDVQSRAFAQSGPWFMSKSLDTFAPMGPCITLPDEIQEPCELALSLRVNGKLRQSSNTRNLIFNVPELIHRLTRHLTIEPGDVIATGTPDGISPIKPGDVMEARIERIGVLRNPVALKG